MHVFTRYLCICCCCCCQVSARAERQAGEVARQEAQLAEEGRAQELEVADITGNYQRLEKVVVAHLQVRFREDLTLPG